MWLGNGWNPVVNLVFDYGPWLRVCQFFPRQMIRYIDYAHVCTVYGYLWRHVPFMGETQ